jgi:putative Mn2+ efflux pump MntP
VKRLCAWLLILIGAFFVLTGIVDLFIGPAYEIIDNPDSEPGSRWLGLIPLGIGVAIVALGIGLDRNKKEPSP